MNTSIEGDVIYSASTQSESNEQPSHKGKAAGKKDIYSPEIDEIPTPLQLSQVFQKSVSWINWCPSGKTSAEDQFHIYDSDYGALHRR